MAAIEVEGLGVGLRLKDMREVFEAQVAFSANSQVAKRIKAALSLLETSFPKKAPLFRNRAMIQSFITLACRIVDAGQDVKKLPLLGKFGAQFQSELSRQVEMGHKATDPDYLAFQKTINANVKAGPRTRHRVLLRKFLRFAPASTELFDSVTLAEAGLKDEIARQGDEIASLVATINDLHSGHHGTDLIKMTNKTNTALTTLRRAAHNFTEWKTVVENLYFLFREGPGNRLDGKWPESFNHINDLRTALQHDVDHGKSGKVARKKKHLAAVFERYAGAPSATVLEPERFPAVQAKLLDAVENDLRKLVGTIAQ